jgi:hypothetical protein
MPGSGDPRGDRPPRRRPCPPGRPPAAASGLPRRRAAIPFRGGSLTIAHDPSARGGIAPDNRLLIVGGRPEHLPRRVRDALRRAALAELKTACDDAFARAGGVSPRPLKAVRIVDPRGRWGSCAADGTLRFSWRLILAPPEILTYVRRTRSPTWRKCRTARNSGRSSPRWATIPPPPRLLKRHGVDLHRVGRPERRHR